MKMNDDELLAQIEHQERQASGYFTGEIAKAQALNEDFYLGKPLGTEEPGRSQVISSDVWDVVEGLTPLILKPFVSSDDTVRFNPLGPDDEQAARQESDYINWVVTQKNDVFNELVSAVKTALKLKNATAKYWWEESRKASIERYFGLTDDVFAAITQEPGVEVVAHNDAGQDEQGQPLHDVTLKTVDTVGQAKYAVLPPEEFLIARDASSPNPQAAKFVQHRRMVTISDLREMGYDVDDSLADEATDDPQFSEQWRARRGEEESYGLQNEAVSGASREVLFKETFLLIDRDGDGIAELRKVCSVGHNILDDEEAEEIPFVSWTPYPQPFKFYGRCPADETVEIQLIKSTLWRQSLDNIYTINNNRVYVSEKVNLDDLLDNQIAGVVRVEGDIVGNHVVPAQVTPIGQVVQPMIEYLDSAKENRTGFTRYNQGTDEDSLNKTATGIRIIKQAGDSRVELVSRAFAEQFLAPLMRGIHGLCRRHATKAETVRLRGEWVPIDPRQWKTRSDLSVSVGLGTADQQMKMQGAQLLIGSQMALLDSPAGAIVQPANIYNAHAKLVESLGYKNPEEYYTSPDKAPPGPDPTKDPHFQLEAHKVMGDLEVKHQQIQLEAKRLMLDAQAAMKPEAAAPDISAHDHLALHADVANNVADRKSELSIAQMKDQTERWKALLDAEVKREIAALQAAAAEKATGTDAEGQPTAEAPDIGEVLKSMTAILETMSKPKTVIRDANGRVTGVQ